MAIYVDADILHLKQNEIFVQINHSNRLLLLGVLEKDDFSFDDQKERQIYNKTPYLLNRKI